MSSSYSSLWSLLWSWPGLAGLFGTLCAIASLFDIMLNNPYSDLLINQRCKKKIKDALTEFEEKIEHVPIRNWQIRVARGGVNLWERFYGGKSILSILTPLMEGGPIWLQLLGFLLFITLFFGPIVLISFTIGPQFPSSAGGSRVLNIFALPGLIFLFITFLYSLYALIFITIKSFRTKIDKISNWLMEGLFWSYLYSYLSALYTAIAYLIGLGISKEPCTSFWFYPVENTYWPSNTLTLALFNYPFDVLTLIISIKLLKWLIDKERRIEIIAAIDIVISAILAIVLHTMLKIVEPGASIFNILTYLVESCRWFMEVITLHAGPEHANWPLTPVLLTTFIPLAVYMSIFISLGLILKLPMKLASRFIRLITKRDAPLLKLIISLIEVVLVIKSWTVLIKIK